MSGHVGSYWRRACGFPQADSFIRTRPASSWRRWLQSLLLGLFLPLALGAAEDKGFLRVRIIGADDTLMPARAWVDDAAGQRHFQPAGPADCTAYARDRSFSCDGWFEIAVPAGRVVVHAEKGKEFLPTDLPVDVRAGERAEVSIKLMRWVNMPDQGYCSADLHVHFGHDNLRVLRQLSLADDVHVVPAFSTWLRGNEKAWAAEWPVWEGGAISTVDGRHLVTRDNLEIERIAGRDSRDLSVGAAFIFNLARPVSAERFDPRFPSNTALCQWAKRTSPECIIDTDKPSWGESVIGAALGVYDTVQVCHNHYHRLATLAGGWGMAGALAPDEKDLSEPDELFRRTNSHYYHWLNCGIRLAAAGGSAMGVMPVPLGHSRTYAKIDGELSPVKFWAAVKAGKTFATTGPMLTLAIDGQEMGATITRRSSQAAPLEVRLHLQTIDAIRSLELVENGEVQRHEIPPAPKAGAGLEHRVTWLVSPARSGWYAARALYVAPDGRLRQAHTSPIYVIVDAKPIAFKTSAEYMRRRVDQLVEVASQAGRYRTEADQREVLATYQQAQRFYETVAATASKVWGD